MDTAQFFGFLLITLVGGLMLALILEFLNTERYQKKAERRPRTDVEPAVQSVVALPAFLPKLGAHDHPSAMPGFDVALLAYLENHVKAEQTMVTNFVHSPSVDTLYRRARPSPPMN